MSSLGAAASSPATPQPPPQPPPPRTCFNTFCKEPTKADGRRRGWRLRSGDFAELCERCLCSYEQGNFCETFHNEIAGWRNCEACGKKVHCGCIVSLHAYMLLDAGGVDCIACARKSFGTVSPSNQMWVPSPSSSSSAIHHYHPRMHSQPMRPPFPGQWRLNISSAQSDLQQRLAFEFDRPRCASASMHHPDKKFDELPERNNGASQIMNHHNVMRERFGNGAGGPPGLDPAYPYSIYHRVPENPNPNSSSNLSSNPSMNNTHPSLNPGNHNMSPNPNGNLNASPSEGMENVTVFNNKGITGFFGPEGSEMMRSGGRPRLDGRNRAQQLLPRYWPRITDQELQLINGDSNSVITPLFEKMLSASDAGRIGRLVLPKKCAEAYFPAIQTPEGLPLTVQDANGKNWTFQFRFWPNNNSRMYVLEGITPCIQAMNLQAGDTVTFSRIDPEGKLVMGFRKAAPVHGEPEIQHLKSGSGFLTCPPPDINSINNINNNNNNNNNHNNNNNNNHNNNNPHNNNKTDIKDPTNATTTTSQSETGPHSSIFKEPSTVGPTPLFPSRRRASNNNNLSGGKITKRLRIENEDSMELKVTWEEAQSLLRPPPDVVPSVTIVDGHEFEEYEEPPVLGRRTYFVTNRAGETHQWAQCCECMKWRKIPTDALLTAKWACSENVWDSDRSSCSSPAELTLEQLVELMPTRVGGTKRKLKVETADPSATCPSSDGLDTLANLAILDQHHSSDVPPGSSAASPTTRHPRHRLGCSCIVCIQPPSGKGGPKHKSSCVCNVCITVRRRFRTLMMRKDFKRSFLGDEGTNGEETPGAAGGRMIGAGPLVIGGDFGPGPACCSGDDAKNNMLPTSSSSSPIKTQIDLNIQPEKEEDTSPKSLDVLAATSAIKLLQEAPVQETPAASS